MVERFLQPIVAPYLATGTYRVLGDNGGDGAGNVLSEAFTVGPCTGDDCTTAIADSPARRVEGRGRSGAQRTCGRVLRLDGL